MGFTRCVLPARNVPDEPLPGIELLGVDTLEEALERLSGGD
jgi:DNA repair protein RadA/Sms